MVVFIKSQVGLDLPQDPLLWSVSRVDVTGNLLLDDLAAVRVALRLLRECEGGRYRVSQQAGDTVYWSHRSRLRSGKAYAKGPHIRYQISQKGYTGRPYASSELELLDRLLRLELKLGSQWLRERAGKPWHQLTPDDLRSQWREYFEKMIGESEMTEENLFDRISQAAEAIRLEKNRSALDKYDELASKLEPAEQLRLKPPRQVESSEGMAKAAYAFYLLIQKEGWQKVRELHSRNSKPSQTYYRNLSVLHRAGLGDMDISSGNVVPIRRKIIECQIVESWDDLLKVA
jgi:II/X family phage/plasmid replication protein